VSRRDKSRYKQLARDAYEAVLNQAAGRCDLEDVRDEILARIVALGVSDDIVDDFVDGLLAAEDGRQSSGADSGQYDLFSGEPEALDAVWRLGGGTRVRCRHATRADWYVRLAIKEQNLAAVKDAYDRELARAAKLMPYMTDDTITTEAALEAWRRDNP
jgi:hypothetical protein